MYSSNRISIEDKKSYILNTGMNPYITYKKCKFRILETKSGHLSIIIIKQSLSVCRSIETDLTDLEFGNCKHFGQILKFELIFN